MNPAVNPDAAAPASSEALSRLEARVGVLVRRYRVLAEGMRDLPLYNPAIAVEAIDFQPFAAQGIGVLLTPWFMNVVLLPLEPVPFDMNRVGVKEIIELPAGPRNFMLGGDDVTGMFKSLSLHSPLFEFTTHDAATAAARRQLAALLTPTVQETGQNGGEHKARTTLYEQRDAAPSRRSLLFGQRT